MLINAMVAVLVKSSALLFMRHRNTAAVIQQGLVSMLSVSD